jgi:hypothetical protein
MGLDLKISILKLQIWPIVVAQSWPGLPVNIYVSKIDPWFQ